MTNEHGLDTHYFTKWMSKVVRDIKLFTPEEFARETARMAVVANGSVFDEEEFSSWMTVEKIGLPENNQIVDIFDINGERVTDVRFVAEDNENFARWIEEPKSEGHLQREYTTALISFWRFAPELPAID